MPTGQTIATNTLTKLGLNGPNATPGPSDSASVITALNTMWDAWSIDEGLIYATIAPQFPLTAYQQNYSIGAGSGANWVATARPSRVYSAAVVNAVAFNGTITTGLEAVTVPDTTGLYVGMRVLAAGIPYNTTILQVVTNFAIQISRPATATGTLLPLVATGLNRNELKLVDSRQYLSHNDLGASATTPEELYAQFIPDANNNSEIRVWPVVNENQKSYIELELAVPFVSWTLSGVYNLPYGYQDAIEWAVAFRMLSTYGVAVQSQVAQVVMAEGAKAEARIREMNSKNRMLPEPAVQNPGAQEAAAQKGQ